MKIFFFILWLFSGSVSCSDVIGYPGGSVRILCHHKDRRTVNTYFCKVQQNECVNHENVSLIEYPEYLEVTYRNLRLQAAGLYQCGGTGVWNHTVNLKVNQDSCCLRSKTVTGHLGETLTISCSYPEQFKPNYKFFYKQHGQKFNELIRTTDSQRGRFSISDNTGSKVLSVNISDLREEDGGVYYCGVWNGGWTVRYYSLYTEIQLQVSGSKKETTPKTTAPVRSSTTSEKPTAAAYWMTSTTATAAATDGGHFSFFLIITVSVCAALLLIGGSVLIIYILRCKKSTVNAFWVTKTADGVYENYPIREEDNISMDPIYESIYPQDSQLNSFY